LQGGFCEVHICIDIYNVYTCIHIYIYILYTYVFIYAGCGGFVGLVGGVCREVCVE